MRTSSLKWLKKGAPWALYYVLPIALVTLGRLIIVALPFKAGSGAALLILISTVMLSALVGGIGPGLFATALSVALADYLFIDPQFSFAMYDPTAISRVTIFLIQVILFSLLCGAVRRLLIERQENLLREMAARRRVEDLNAALTREVGEHQKSLRQIEEQATRLYFVNMATNDAIWDWDLATNKIRWNDAFLTQFGYGWGCREGQGFDHEARLARIHPSDRERVALGLIEALRGGRKRWSSEYRFLRTNGAYASVLDRGYVVVNSLGRASRMIGAMQDISERVRADEAKSREQQRALLLQQEAQAANQAKTAFLANVSHEIRTPLEAILGFAELMKNPEQSAAERMNCLQIILRNGERLAHVVNDILDLSKIESDKLEVEGIQTDLIELVDSVIATLALQAQIKGLSLKVVYKRHFNAQAVTDPTRLSQILLNLIGNAVKFTERGGIEVHISEELLASHSAACGSKVGERLIHFQVRDSGPGISPAQAERLFQPFTQADSSMTRKFGGTGLGLALAKKLCLALGGDLKLLWSGLQRGSCFIATIACPPTPLNGANSQPETRRLPAPEGSQSSGGAPSETLIGAKRILVVEDSDDNRLLFSRFLELAGAQVQFACDGQEGLEIALRSEFDLVLMDIQMPRMDGYEAIRQLRAAQYAKPVVALTANAMKGEREHCLRLGFDEHLAKPINREALVALVNRFVPLTHAEISAKLVTNP